MILLGTAGSLVQTPWGEHDEYDYWACGSVISHEVSKDKKVDAVFEIHQRDVWYDDKILKVFDDYIKQFPEVIVYMQYKNNDIKNSETFPLDEIKKLAKNELLAKYHTSTISYMIALAISMKYEKILMYGCHMSAQEEEYSNQRACCEAWLNYGLGLGTDYWLTPETDLMKCSHLYGYEQHKDTYLKLTQISNGLKVALKEYETAKIKADSDLQQQTGGVIMLERVMREFRD